ncbi:hypothetical protein O181_124194 [Austropuccinia psidii MF-1]|uniref:Uncharacterized protein n=1 Tax=Austropuccinia psidii MF-1 TaxID=1389203 RepID=A0A9Q3Q405_9BASI|nr:hypothetical protein [Austropuccinia psidii MF-1]
MTSGNPQRPPAAQIHSSPQLKGKIFPSLHAPRTQGCRSGAYMVLYTIMHHFCSGNPWRLSEEHFRTSSTWLCRSWVENSSRIISRAILRGYSSFNQLSRQQALNTPWTTQLIHTGNNQSTCTSLAQLGQFILHCGDSITRFNFQDGQNCIGPIQTIQPDDSPFRISLSVFHIYRPPFITWGLFSPVD